MDILRWAARGVVGVAVAVGLNYHLSRPLVDVYALKEKELGRPPTPFSYPEDLSTPTAIKVVNSIFDTTHYLGFYRVRVKGKDTEKLLEDLGELLDPKVFESVKEGVRLMDESINQDLGCSPMEVILNGESLKKRLRTWIAIEREMKKEKEILEKEKLKPQIVITGQFRTGSTFLHQLLSQDPSCRYLTQWEQELPIPFPTAANYFSDERIEKKKKEMLSINNVVNNWTKYFWMYHDVDGTGVEEETYLLLMTLAHPLFNHWKSPYNQWALTEPKDYQYHFLKRFLLLNQHYHPPTSHWVLKSPFHCYFFPSFMREFDGSFVVVTHRDPVFTVPSYAKLSYFVGSLYVRDVKTFALTRYMSREEFGKDICESVKIGITNMYKWRDRPASERVGEREKREREEGRILDVEYEELLKNPIGVVKEIYKRAGLVLTEEAEKKMRDYLEENRKEREKGKGSRHSPYSLEEFGIDDRYVKNEMAEYRVRRGYDKKDAK